MLLLLFVAVAVADADAVLTFAFEQRNVSDLYVFPRLLVSPPRQHLAHQLVETIKPSEVVALRACRRDGPGQARTD